jgi:hypothetical protein
MMRENPKDLEVLRHMQDPAITDVDKALCGTPINYPWDLIREDSSNVNCPDCLNDLELLRSENG